MIHFDSEKDMEDCIFENNDHFQNFFGYGKCVRQIKLGAYGVCDLLYWQLMPAHGDEGSDTLVIELVELKNTPISYKHIGQCARYKTFFDKLQESSSYKVDFCAHLVGLKTFGLDDGDLCFLGQSIDWLTVHEMTLDAIDGIDLSPVEGWRRGDFEPQHIVRFISDISGDGSDGEN